MFIRPAQRGDSFLRHFLMSKNNATHCSFCGRSKNETDLLITGMDAHICGDCIEQASKIILEEKVAHSGKGNKKGKKTDIPKPTAIKFYLDQYVIGQEKAKKVLSVAVYNHLKRINHSVDAQEVEIEKSNVLLIGETGTGKTLLARTIAKLLDVPFCIADATVFTEAGYVGEDVENILLRLIQAADYDIPRAERGIIYIDEIDKIARKSENTSITRDVSGEGVQQALLKIVEGTKCRVSLTGARKHPNSEMVEIDTTNILFIAGGAFVGINDIVQNRIKGTSIGFNAVVKVDGDQLLEITPDDLTKFGMIPEFIGRFTTSINLEELTKDQLIEVLTEVKNNFIQQYQYIFSLDEIDLVIERDAVEQIAENCITMKTGARALQTQLEKVLLPHMYNVSLYKENNIKQININRNLVIEPQTYEFKR